MIRKKSKDYYSIEPIPENITALESMKKDFSLVILTNRAQPFRDSAIRWLEMHLSQYITNIIFAKDYPEHNYSKGKICSEMGVSLLVDDSPKNIFSCLDSSVPVVAYKRPWNKNIPDDVLRVSSLKELINCSRLFLS